MIDYKKEGFRCGIEIHQRLASKEKLFCSCPACSNEEKNSSEVIRKQRAVAGELGLVDAAAMHEQKRDRQFVYRVYPSSSCEVDEDDEPPHKMNSEALEIALQVALMINADVVDEVEVMRKAVLDGSNTGGFQRTAVIALNGVVKTPRGDVRVPTISLEEEACAIEGETPSGIAYGLNRLGIPLIEIGTETDIVDAAHCREVAQTIGQLLRATGKVQRGIGTIRQDVNVSIFRGARVEIKGVQELDRLPEIVENEVKRQIGLVDVRDELKKRKATEFPLKMVDVSSVFSSTTCRMIRKSLDSHEKLLAFALPKFAGLLGFELFPGRRLGTEMSDYAKTQGVGGLIHSDEQLAKYPITPEEIAAVCKLTGATSADGWIMIAAPEEKATRAVAAAYSRALIALKGVPEETRKIVKDVESAYMRPLPGGARLYPETDLPPVRVTRKMLSALEMPEMPEEKLARLKKILNDELAVKIFKSPRASTFEKVVASVKGIDATLVASTLEETLIGLKRDGVAVENVSDDAFVELFALSGKFVKAAIPEILKLVASGESVSSAASKFKKMSLKEIESVVAEEKKTTSDKGLLIKRVMERLRLYAEGSEVMKVLKQ